MNNQTSARPLSFLSTCNFLATNWIDNIAAVSSSTLCHAFINASQPLLWFNVSLKATYHAPVIIRTLLTLSSIAIVFVLAFTKKENALILTDDSIARTITAGSGRSLFGRNDAKIIAKFVFSFIVSKRRHQSS